LESVNKELSKLKIIGYLSSVMLGLGLYGLFYADGNAFHPLLNNLNILYGLVTVGAAISIWETIVFIKLTKRKSKLIREENT